MNEPIIAVAPFWVWLLVLVFLFTVAAGIGALVCRLLFCRRDTIPCPPPRMSVPPRPKTDTLVSWP